MTLTVILQIYREGIESQNPARVLTCLHTLTDSCEKVLRFQGPWSLWSLGMMRIRRKFGKHPEFACIFPGWWPNGRIFLVSGPGFRQHCFAHCAVVRNCCCAKLKSFVQTIRLDQHFKAAVIINHMGGDVVSAIYCAGKKSYHTGGNDTLRAGGRTLCASK